MDATQTDTAERLPERPAELVPPDDADPIGAMLDDYPIGSVPATPER